MKNMYSESRKIFVCIPAAMLCALALSGCYPKPVGPAGPDGMRLTWEEMTMEQRGDHMKREVMPRAVEIFRAWRPGRFARVDCALCHDLRGAKNNFGMPSARLPRLSGDWTLSPEFAKHPDTTRLKLDRLVPAMAASLGKKSFSILTRRGFGCYSCHMGPSGPLFGK